MARELNISVPEKLTQEILDKIKTRDGLLSLSVQRGKSIKPKGDVITMTVTNSSLRTYMHLLEEYRIGKKGGVSIATSEPDCVITDVPDLMIERDGQEAIWEEVETVISTDSNMTYNILGLMVMSGIITTVGLATSTIHIVIGGMLVAPGFMPLMRITLGLATKNSYWYYGITDFLKGYFSLMGGAVIATLVLRALGTDPLSPEQEYYELHNTLIDYWTQITASSVLSSAAATVVGVLLLSTKRTIFTSGVMIALALIPAATLVPIGVISGKWDIAGMAALRFAVDIGLILAISIPMFYAKQYWVHRRSIKL